jgi:cyclophilin family peptidyl-prolyl cis-trans isomerase
MMRRIGMITGALLLALASQAFAQTGAAPARKPAAKPGAAVAAATLVVETSRGVFEIETFPDTAPRTVAHIVALVKKGFYNGLRVHRVVPGFVVQFGDPFTRDMAKRDLWGTGDSGKPIGVAEMSKQHTHDKKGMVAMAHGGDPRTTADSQFYITLAPQPQLDSNYPVWGQIVSGMDIVEKTQELDVIKKISVK